MEEKERYELIGYCSYRDTETGVIGDNFVGVLNEQDQKIKDLETKLEEIQNEKDELISKYRYWKGECAELKEQLAKEQKHISRLKNMNKSHDEAVGRLTEENNQLKYQLHSQPAEIVGKIRSKCCVEDKCKDGSFVLGINEKYLDTILKEYQK